MNHEFTQRLNQWLSTPAEKRNWQEGAMMLLQLSNNKILYRNIISGINTLLRREQLEYNLRKYYNFRVQQLTHVQVKEMQTKVDEIVEKDLPLAAKADAQTTGKRPDHDSLPDEIKALYVENLDILRRMRELHLQLRSRSVTDSPCPDSERYPFLKELISLDKKLHANWKAYDEYNPAAADTSTVAVKAKTTRKKRTSTKAS